MRINPDFILREIAGECVLIPTGEAARNFSGLIALNSTGKFLFDLLQNDMTEERLVFEMLEIYDADETEVRRDINLFLTALREKNMIID